MISISEIDITLTPVETARSNRNALLKQLYQLYISQPDIQRKENKRRYFNYLKKYRKGVLRKDMTEAEWNAHKEEFKKKKLPKEEKFISYIKEDRFWYFFSHCDIDGLEKLVSEAKDILHRYEMANWDDKDKYVVSRFIMGSVKHVDKPLA
jgi:hypothetical protein